MLTPSSGIGEGIRDQGQGSGVRSQVMSQSETRDTYSRFAAYKHLSIVNSRGECASLEADELAAAAYNEQVQRCDAPAAFLISGGEHFSMDPQRERIQADLRGLLAGDVFCDD